MDVPLYEVGLVLLGAMLTPIVRDLYLYAKRGVFQIGSIPRKLWTKRKREKEVAKLVEKAKPDDLR